MSMSWSELLLLLILLIDFLEKNDHIFYTLCLKTSWETFHMTFKNPQLMTIKYFFVIVVRYRIVRVLISVSLCFDYQRSQGSKM